jgi:hypothetical protein
MRCQRVLRQQAVSSSSLDCARFPDRKQDVFTNVCYLRSQHLAVQSKLTTLQEELLEHLTSTPASSVEAITAPDTAGDSSRRPQNQASKNGQRGQSKAPVHTPGSYSLGSSHSTEARAHSQKSQHGDSSVIHAAGSGSGGHSVSVPSDASCTGSVPSHRDLLLTVVPYFKLLSYPSPVPGTTSGPTSQPPRYSDRLDWLLLHLYDQQGSAPTFGLHGAMAARGGRGVPAVVTGRDAETLAGGALGADGLDEQIDEFE